MKSRYRGEVLLRYPRTWLALSATFVIVGNAKAELPDLTGGYLCTGRCGSIGSCLRIQQDGAELNISNEDGYRTFGRFQGNSIIQAMDWIDAQNGFVDGIILQNPTRVEWGNNAKWIRTALCPSP